MADKTVAVTIRPRRISDDDSIYALSQQVFSIYSRDPLLVMKSMLSESGAYAAVAELDTRFAGLIVLGFTQLKRDLGPWKQPLLARLNAIAVRPDVQGAGVGRRLLLHAEELARKRGGVSMTLMTAENNVRARRLFESHGFLTLLRFDNVYLRGERALHMFKVLQTDHQ